MSKVMTKGEFKDRWESDYRGGGITFHDIAECAMGWGICAQPQTRPIEDIQYAVLKAAGTNDAEEFNPMVSIDARLIDEARKALETA